MLIWLITSFWIAIWNELVARDDVIPIYWAILVIILSILVGNIGILIMTRLFYWTYVYNIKEAFERAQNLLPPIFIPKVRRPNS